MKRLWFAAAIGHLAATVALLVLFRLGGEKWGWVALVFYAPRLFFALPAPLVLAGLWLTGSRRLCWLPAFSALLAFGPLMGFHVPVPQALPLRAAAAAPSAREVRLLTCNVWFGAGDLPLLAREIKDAAPDIVVFEAAAHNADVLLRRPPFSFYLHVDQFVVASRWPVRKRSEGTFASAHFHRPWVRFEADSPLGTLDLVAVHPHSPRQLFARGALRPLVEAGPAGDPGRILAFLDAQLAEVASAAHGPLAVFAGDFNVPGGGSLLPRLFDGLTDSFDEAGLGYGYTFPVNGHRVPWMRLDRVLHGPGLRATGIQVDPRGGSDHAAVTVTLAKPL